VTDPRERFSDRVEDYVRYRPGYPRAWLDWVAGETGLEPGRVVIDLGAGTGILSSLLLASGATVIGVEPNGPMRAAAERLLAAEERFACMNGSAEATGLAAESADLATAGQAFHWFDVGRTRTELLRVLRPPGWVALVWNMRTSTPFNDAYEAMLEEFAPEYPAVRARDRVLDESLSLLFASKQPMVAHFPNAQRLDEAALRGRLLSSSYVPKPGHPAHDRLIVRAHAVFAEHSRGGLVELAYDTVSYVGQLWPGIRPGGGTAGDP
jgi:SAM-dependent methyltransferase